MEIAAEVKDKVDWLLKHTPKTLAESIGIEYTLLGPKKVMASIEVLDRVKQPFGLLHGGVSVALAESLASVGGWLNVDEKKFAVVGIEINANHLRAMKSGKIVGTATPVHIGRKTQVWEIKIESQDGKPVCVSRCTLAVVPLNEI